MDTLRSKSSVTWRRAGAALALLLALAVTVRAGEVGSPTPHREPVAGDRSLQQIVSLLQAASGGESGIDVQVEAHPEVAAPTGNETLSPPASQGQAPSATIEVSGTIRIRFFLPDGAGALSMGSFGTPLSPPGTAPSVPALAAIAPIPTTPPAAEGPDLSALPDYKIKEGIHGVVNSVGSDTLNNLMMLWADHFNKRYPGVTTNHEGRGSSTAPPALLERTSDLGPMSRPMKEKELALFASRYGYKPTRIGVAVDCLAVYVNDRNPIKGLTLKNLDGIFSASRKSGSDPIERWGQLGLGGEWQKMPIRLFGRNSQSGTYGYFKDHALKKGDYSPLVVEMPGSSAVVQAIAENRAAIGYSGIGYKLAGVRVVPLSREENEPFAKATFENALNGSYPLGRILYIYCLKEPGKPLPAHVRELLLFILSREGQELVAKEGYGPLPAHMVADMRKLLE